jgi:ubiquinone/menaquinone biosynthesis C-methylase UbiE
MEHLERVRQEFARQADRFGSAAAVTDADLTRRFIDAVGSDGEGLILDLACGPGIMSAALAPRARAVVALDVTPAMLRNARRRCAAAGLGNVTFVEGGAADLPFAADAFDTVATRLSLHHFKEPQRVLSEVRRVLRLAAPSSPPTSSAPTIERNRRCTTPWRCCAIRPMCGCCRPPSSRR